jgi:hypothetical protein
MKIDLAALRLFHATWKPVVDAVPAVMEMAEKQADFDRAIAAKKFEFEEAEKKIADAYTEANKRLTVLNEQMELAIKQQKEAADETARLVADREREIADAGISRKKTLANIEAKLAAAETALAKVEADTVAKLAAADADIKAKTEAAEAALQAIEAKQKAAEAALEAIKAKLG